MIRHLIALVLFLVPASVSAAGLIDATPRIALMSAFEPEWRVLVDDVEEARTHRLNGVEFVTGRLADRDVVLFLSGISMVNAAMTTQLAVDRFNVRRIVFSGIAGGLDPDLDIGDVVVSARWGQYFDLFLARETEGGFQVPPWMKSEFPNYGMMFTRNIEVASAGKDRPEEKFWFASDPRMLSAAEKVARNLVLPACSPDGDCLGRPPRIRVGGNGVSGSAFVDNAAFRAFVFEAFEARVVDMESAAVAHVAYANGLPFIAIRSLSDLAGGGENENELPVFFKLAAANSARVVRVPSSQHWTDPVTAVPGSVKPSPIVIIPASGPEPEALGPGERDRSLHTPHVPGKPAVLAYAGRERAGPPCQDRAHAEP